MGFLISEAAGGNVLLSKADGGTLAVQPAPGGSALGGVLIVPTIAALSAISVLALQNTQPAEVQSNGSAWNLSPIGAMTIDGITVAATLDDPARVWERTGSAVVQAAAAQAAWFVDPQNVTGVASDENSGADALHPLKSKAEIARRWGSWSPELVNGISVTVQMLSADVAGEFGINDPWLARPYFRGGASLMVFAALPAPGFTGTLNVVTPKSRPGNTPLKATVTTTTGVLAVGMLLINSTRGNSRAFVLDITGGVATLSQPLAPWLPGTFVPFPIVPVDTWAHNDVIEGFALLQVDLPVLGGITAEFGNTFSHVAYQVQIHDASGIANFNPTTLEPTAAWAIMECAVDRQLVGTAGDGTGGSLYNVCSLLTSLLEGGSSVSTLRIIGGGVLQGTGIYSGTGTFIQNDHVLLQPFIFEGVTFDSVCIASGELTLRGLCVNQVAVYGAGSANVQEGRCIYTAPASAAWPAAGGLKCAGSSSAYSNATSAGVVTTHRLALTAAALDAAAGAAGFGGLAYVPGAAISTGAVP